MSPIRSASLPGGLVALTRARIVLCLMSRRSSARRAVAGGLAEPQGAGLRGCEPGPHLLAHRRPALVPLWYNTYGERAGPVAIGQAGYGADEKWRLEGRQIKSAPL